MRHQRVQHAISLSIPRRSSRLGDDPGTTTRYSSGSLLARSRSGSERRRVGSGVGPTVEFTKVSKWASSSSACSCVLWRWAQSWRRREGGGGGGFVQRLVGCATIAMEFLARTCARWRASCACGGVGGTGSGAFLRRFPCYFVLNMDEPTVWCDAFTEWTKAWVIATEGTAIEASKLEEVDQKNFMQHLLVEPLLEWITKDTDMPRELPCGEGSDCLLWLQLCCAPAH